MKIKTAFLTPNPFSRPGSVLKEVRAIVMHWTANPKANAMENRNWFEMRKDGTNGYGSAHYIIDQDGSVIIDIPETEVAYHAGSSDIDPVSKKVYTDEMRERCKGYSNPNYCTLSIELCPVDMDGNFTPETIESAIVLCADICKRHGLKADDITTHHNLVGWKDCPRLWTNKPELLDAFRYSVQDRMIRGE